MSRKPIYRDTVYLTMPTVLEQNLRPPNRSIKLPLRQTIWAQRIAYNYYQSEANMLIFLSDPWESEPFWSQWSSDSTEWRGQSESDCTKNRSRTTSLVWKYSVIHRFYRLFAEKWALVLNWGQRWGWGVNFWGVLRWRDDEEKILSLIHISEPTRPY